MKYIIAHDLGTSGNKASLFSESGKLIASRVHPYGAHYFNGTWVEQNADDWWNAVCMSTKDLLGSTGTDPGAVAAVSFSGQMMGCLCVDSEGVPLRPAIIWADQRAQEQAWQIEQHISQLDFYQIVGHRNTASYGIQKLMWVRDNEPDIYERTHVVLNAKDYIVFKLTGHFCTDYSDGNSMGCFDINKRSWSEELLSYAGISQDKLPECRPSTFCAGTVTGAAARECGLAEGTKVILGSGDGVAASVGAGSVEPGKTYCCLGTSAWVTTASEKPVFDEQMRTVNWAHAVPGLYAPNGTMQYAGGSYSWVKNVICQMESIRAKENNTSAYDYMNDEIAQSPPGANGVVFLPYLLGERAPRWDPFAKGAWIGMQPETTRADMLRSVLEGITLNLGIILDILKAQVPIDEITVLGGGAKGESWQRILSGIFGTKILVPTVLEEASSMGAAVIAGVGAGLFSDFSVINDFIEINTVLEPKPEEVEFYRDLRSRFDDYYFALKSTYEKYAQ